MSKGLPSMGSQRQQRRRSGHHHEKTKQGDGQSAWNRRVLVIRRQEDNAIFEARNARATRVVTMADVVGVWVRDRNPTWIDVGVAELSLRKVMVKGRPEGGHHDSDDTEHN